MPEGARWHVAVADTRRVEQLAGALSSRAPRVILARRRAELLALWPQDEPESLVRKVLADTCTACNLSLQTWGLARTPVLLSALRDGYQEATEARALVQSLGREAIGDPHELGPFLLLGRLGTDATAIELCPGRAGEPRAIRRDSDRRLLSTLDGFLRNHGNTSLTARELHYGRSTLFLSLRKIEQLTGCSLGHPDERFLVELCLRILQVHDTDVRALLKRHSSSPELADGNRVLAS